MATLPTRVLRRHGLSLHQRAPGSSPTIRGLGPTRHASWPRTEAARPPRAEHVTAQRLQALLHLRLNQRVNGRTAMQATCNCTTGTHPFNFDASSMEAQAHTSCNRRAGYHVRKTAPPLRQCRASSTAEPVPRLEATLRTAQQCQPSASVTGQSAAGEGATVDMAKSGPAVMAAAGGRK
jgi:hypothetical protein